MLSTIEPTVPPLLDPVFLGSVVFPWTNTIAALFSIAISIYYVYKTRSLLPEVAIAILPLILAAIGYGFYAAKVIDQAGLTLMVRPTLFLVYISISLVCIRELRRREIWKTHASKPSSK